MTALERAIYDAEGRLLAALWALRVTRNFQSAALSATRAVDLIKAIGEDEIRPPPREHRKELW